MLFTIIITLTVIVHVFVLNVVFSSVKRKDVLAMKRLFIIAFTISIIMFGLVDLLHQYKEQQNIKECPFTVQEIVAAYRSNENIYVSNKEVIDIYNNIALAYCKEHNLKEKPELVIYEETRYGLYHETGRFDKHNNIIYLNRRTKGNVQYLQNANKKEVIKSILYLIDK